MYLRKMEGVKKQEYRESNHFIVGKEEKQIKTCQFQCPTL